MLTQHPVPLLNWLSFNLKRCRGLSVHLDSLPFNNVYFSLEEPSSVHRSWIIVIKWSYRDSSCFAKVLPVTWSGLVRACRPIDPLPICLLNIVNTTWLLSFAGNSDLQSHEVKWFNCRANFQCMCSLDERFFKGSLLRIIPERHPFINMKTKKTDHLPETRNITF